MDTHWHNKFLDLAKLISTWSKDPSTKVGAVIVNPETKQVVGMGYNGFPRGVLDSESRLTTRKQKYKFICHAEVNAVLNANQSVCGCSIYVYPTLMIPNCCPECAKVVVQSGIKNVYAWKEDTLIDRWQDLASYSKIMFDEGGVAYHSIRKDPS